MVNHEHVVFGGCAGVVERDRLGVIRSSTDVLETEAPYGSVAVTVMRYSPFTPVLVWSDAQLASWPEKVPVAVSNVRPPGTWSTGKVRTSLLPRR